ncbi:MAG: hypothetical protein ACRD94_01575, partial [Nitrosopumilaceae archaeon]
DYTAFRTWLLAANANNAAYMLSAQLAAMELNVLNGKVSADTVIVSGPVGPISIGDLMAAADAALLADGFTPSGDEPNRTTQLNLKDALDAANNNRNIALCVT